jgi:hypothetical protein
VKAAYVVIALALGIAGALPAPAQTTPRTLAYSFSISARTFGGGQVPNDFVYSDSAVWVSGRSGVITVEAGPSAADGGVVLTATESVKQSARPRPAIRCTAYGATMRIECDWEHSEPTSEELTLFEFLGSSFYDPTRLDSKAHWRVSARVADNDAVSDFTVEKAQGDTLTIAVETKEQGRGVWARFRETEEGSVLYDLLSAAPTRIRLTVYQVVPDRQTDVTVDLDLISDSRAGAASPSPH